MPPTPEELASWIRAAWIAADVPPDDDLAAWTKYLNRCLADHAEAQRLEAYGAGLGSGKGEYLVDHCWSAPCATMSEYRGLELAAEFEWNGTRGALEEDIVKLADIRAPARLFVGTLRTIPWKDADAIANDVSAMLAAHRLDEREWIVLALAPKGRPGSDGQLKIWKINPGRARLLSPPSP